MAAYGDVTCDICGVSYYEEDIHICDMYSVSQRIQQLEAQLAGDAKLLIESAEIVTAYAKETDELRADNKEIGKLAVDKAEECGRLRAEVERYKAALKFYANPDTYPTKGCERLHSVAASALQQEDKGC